MRNSRKRWKACLFITESPPDRAAALPITGESERAKIPALLAEIRGHRGARLGHTASRGRQRLTFATRAATHPFAAALLRAHDHALSTASLETLSIIAYSSP